MIPFSAIMVNAILFIIIQIFITQTMGESVSLYIKNPKPLPLNPVSVLRINQYVPATIPILSTVSTTSISFTTAISGGNITSSGGARVRSRGICWSLNQNPTIEDSKTIDGSGKGIFESDISDLEPGTAYYIRAYAINRIGIAYGNEVSFSSVAIVVPTLSTTSITAIDYTSGVSGGNISSDGGGSVIERGICWSLSTNPTTGDSKVASGSGIGSFSSSLSGLTQGTTYHVRAYATNSVGTAYGNDVSFLTEVPATLATISTAAIVGVMSGGVITSDGGASVTARGICWSLSVNPTISDSKTVNGSGVGSFIGVMSGASHNTLYHIRAYATNSVGTAYGSDLTITPDFTFRFKVQTTTANKAINLSHPQTNGAGYSYVYNYVINYGDGTGDKTVTSYNDADCAHPYVSVGTYNVTILGTCECFFPWSSTSGGFSALLKEVTSWGNVGAKRVAFDSASNFTTVVADIYGCFANLVEANFDSSAISNLPQKLFYHAKNISNFNGTFGNCRSLISLPSDLFEQNTSVLSFNTTFMYCYYMTSVPADLFRYNTEVTSFQNTFNSCQVLGAIPTDFFKYNTKVTSFSATFSFCYGLTSIPAGMFDTCTAVTGFYGFHFTFNYCKNVTAIPAGLFDKNVINSHFLATFENCQKLTSIPSGLFDKNVNVVEFHDTFWSCIKLASIPSGLFTYNTLVTGMEGVFQLDPLITSIPSDLFATNINIVYCRDNFKNCTGLLTIPSGLFTNNTLITNFDENFSGCVALTGAAPSLWTRTNPTPVGPTCFLGDTGLSNYASIPAGWK